MTEFAVGDAALFRDALRVLNQPKRHGDILAFFLAFKFHQHELPIVGDRNRGIGSAAIEGLLDRFYRKPNVAEDEHAPVCMIFNDRFKPLSSHETNSWRDFLQYGNGIGCMAPEDDFTADFIVEERRSCQYLTTNDKDQPACALHPKMTRYIRGLQKPKLLFWDQPHRRYKLIDLNRDGMLETMRPFASAVPLESLVIALYHDAPWTTRQSVTVEQFAEDFNFQDAMTVEYLFAVPPVDPVIKAKVEARTKEMKRELRRPFEMTEKYTKSQTLVEKRVRSVAFRSAVMAAYDNSCAICGLRVRATKDNWEAHAAHIYPHRLGGSDDVRNGLALCRSHHWAFDQHLLKVELDYSITWGSLADREWRTYNMLRLPDDPLERPDQAKALEWHRSRFRP